MWIVEKESSHAFASWDGGANWQDLGRPVGTYRLLYDVFFLNDSLGWIAGDGGFIFHTTDYGFSWRIQNQGGTKFAQRIFMLNSQFGWVASGEAIILKTTNGGEEWEQIILPSPPFPADTVDFYGVSFVDSLTGWAVAGRYPIGDTFINGQGYIAKTEDGGRDWILLRRDTIYDFFDCHFINPLEGWVVGGNDQTYEPCVFHTTDGGLNWERQELRGGFYLRACHFIERKGWAVGMFGTILHTTDGGENWVVQRTGGSGTLFDVEFKDTLYGIASGTEIALYTTDGGRNWIQSYVGIVEERQPLETHRGGQVWRKVPPTVDDMVKSGRLSIYDATGKRCATIKQGVYFIKNQGDEMKKILRLR